MPTSIDDLFVHNRAWAAQMERERPGFFTSLLAQQKPKYMWIGCSDSRVPANEIIGVVDLEGGEWGGILSAMPVTTRPKNRQEPEDDYVFNVLAAAAPQFRSDYNGQSSFVHGTTA